MQTTTIIRRNRGSATKPDGTADGVRRKTRAQVAGLHQRHEVTGRGFVRLGHRVTIKDGLLHGGRSGRVVEAADYFVVVEITDNWARNAQPQRTCYTLSEVEPYIEIGYGTGETEELHLIARIARLRVHANRQDYDESLRAAIALRAERLYWRVRLIQRERAHELKCLFGLQSSTALTVMERRAA